MSGQELREGDVFFPDLTDHTGISKNTMKNLHYIAIIMSSCKLNNNDHKTIICVPMTSAHSQLWDAVK